MRTAALAVLLLAAASHAWVLVLPFRADDLAQIPAAREFLVQDFKGGRTAFGEREELFRPVLWASLALEVAAAPEPVPSWLFHLDSLILHAATAVLLLLVLRRVVPSPWSLAAALFFAAQGTGAEAVSWIAARGDALVALFVLLAALGIDRARKTGKLAPSLLAGVALALAVLSKISGIVFLPLALVFQEAGRASLRARAARTASLLLAPALALVWRRAIVGTWELTSPGYGSLDASKPLPVAARLPEILGQLVIPLARPAAREAASPAASEWISAWGFDRRMIAALALLPLVLGALAFGRLQALRKIAIGLVVTGIAAIPVATVLAKGNHDGMERAYYPVAAAWAALLGLAMSSISPGAPSARARRRLLLIAALAIPGGLMLEAHVAMARTELAAKDLVNGVRDAARTAARDLPERGLIAVIGAGSEQTLLGSTSRELPYFWRAPFLHPSRDLAYFSTLEDLIVSPVFQAPGRALLVLSPVEGGLRAVTPLLPAVDESLPLFVEGQDRTSWRPAAAFSPRAAEGIRFLAGKGPAATIGVHIEGRGEVFERTTELSASESPREFSIALRSDRKLALVPEIEAVSLWSGGGALRLEAPPAAFRGIPALEIVGPADRFVWSPGMAAWRFAFRPAPRAARYLLDLRVPAPSGSALIIVYSFSREKARTSDEDRLEYAPDDADWTEGTGRDFTLGRIPALIEQYRASTGLSEVTFRWRIVARTQDGAPVAESAWRLVTFRL